MRRPWRDQRRAAAAPEEPASPAAVQASGARAWAWALAAALLLPAAASAQTRWGLTWRAPDGCLQAAELARGVEDRLGHAVFGPDPQLRIDGEVTAEPAGSRRPGEAAPRWRARLTLVDDRGSVLGSREVTGTEESCRSIDQPLTLVVAVMIDPLVLGHAPPPPQTSAPPLPPEPPPVTLEPRPLPPPPQFTPLLTQPAVDPEEARPSQTVLGLAFALGLAPQWALGLDLAWQVRLAGPLRLDVRLPLYPYLPASSAADAARPAASGWLAGAGLGALVGWLFTPDKLSRWSAVVSVGAEGTTFLTAVRGAASRLDFFGKLDLLARARIHRRLGDRNAWGIQLELEGGWAPLAGTMRLVSADGRPVDLPLGPFRLGVAVAFTSPFG